MAHLLIVDNDERIVELTVWFLCRMGHEVDSALSYAAARDKLAVRRPDLMLADLDLGLESGLEELPRLAAEGCLPPTMVVSGFLDGALEKQLLAIPGVLKTLTKPVDLGALGEHIEGCLAGGVAPAAGALSVDTVSGTSPPLNAATLSEEEIDDGWVEIAPLAVDLTPGVPGAAPAADRGAGA